MQVITFTPNPCVDRTIWAKEFDGDPIRIDYQSGGKGLNVARVLSGLGVDACAVFPAGGETGRRLMDLAAKEGINTHPVPCRTATRVIDTWVRQRDYQCRQDYVRGFPMSSGEVDALEAELYRLLPGARVLAVCGSASCDAVAMRLPRILQRARDLGVATVLDSNGPALMEGVKALPDLLMPNQAELSTLMGRKVEPGEEAEAAERLVERGIGGVLVTLGQDGCAYIRRDGQYFCPTPQVEVVNPVGSGDSFLAGFLYAVLKGYPDSSGALAIANAAGAANAAMFQAGMVRKEDIEKLTGMKLL